MGHTEATLFMEGKVLTLKEKRNKFLTLNKCSDFSFKIFAVQKLVFLKTFSKIHWKITPSTNKLSPDDSTPCHALADVTT